MPNSIQSPPRAERALVCLYIQGFLYHPTPVRSSHMLGVDNTDVPADQGALAHAGHTLRPPRDPGAQRLCRACNCDPPGLKGWRALLARQSWWPCIQPFTRGAERRTIGRLPHLA